MIIGILVGKDAITEQCHEKGITNPDWIDWITDCFERNISNFISQAIEMGSEEIDQSNAKTRLGNSSGRKK